MTSDNQLIGKIRRKQNKDAANDLLGKYYREIYAYTYRQTGDRELAMDLTQDIFVAVLKGLHGFDEKKAEFRTWLYRIASNKIIDYYRSSRHKQTMLQRGMILETGEERGETDEGFERVLQKETIGEVMRIVMGYDIEWARIFQKKCFDELSFREIAEELGISENTAKTRFYTIVKKVREEVRR